MNREVSLLLACCRKFVGNGSREEVHGAYNDDLDWSTLLKVADYHSVMPLLYWGLAIECPNRPQQELCDRFEQHARRNLLATAELLRVLALLDSKGIPAVPIKGPV